jgi:PhoPQ-activated pathogenicity-related protein
MVKASFAIMKGAEEYIKQEKLGDLSAGWIQIGGSKRGWTTWLVGGVNCESCVNMVGIVPLVPIVPSLTSELHRQWRAYQGFSFAFHDYLDVGLMNYIDYDFTKELFAMIDPLTFGEHLARLPKLAVVYSNDEFMMMDWTNIWYDDMMKLGETHVLIAPNADHVMVTNMYGIFSTATAFTKSIASGVTQRPYFNYTYDNTNGEITV